MKLVFKKLNEQAILPTRGTKDSAGLDLYACMEEPVTIAPGALCRIPTGVAVALPENSVGLICGRSGLGVRHGITPSNSVGVIDSDYRGELIVGLCNVGSEPWTIAPNERFAQLLVLPVLMLEPEFREELDETVRGDHGFGSTGTSV